LFFYWIEKRPCAGSADIPGQHHVDVHKWGVLFQFFKTKYESVLVHVQGVLTRTTSRGRARVPHFILVFWLNIHRLCAGSADVPGQHHMDVRQCRVLFYFYTKYETVLVQGVLMSQDNITWTCASAASTYRMREGSEVIVSFLPFSHIVAQVIKS
jgi:hypothetical protein